MKSELVGFIILLHLLAGCSSPMQLASRWHSSDSETSPDSTTYINDQNLAIGTQNDGEYLYLTLLVGNRSTQRQIFFRGLTVWFDYKGGEERRFGIHYPVGAGFPLMDERRPNRERVPDTSWAFPDQLPEDIEILGPMEGEHHTMSIAETKGIIVTIVDRAGTMRYMLKAPLMDNGSHLYGIGARTGTTIGIGVETGDLPARPRRDGSQIGFGGGGMNPPGGYGGRGARGSPPPGSGERREPLKFWTKIHLAEEPHP